jgi:hypothetical protein
MARLVLVGLVVSGLLHDAALAESKEPYVESTTGFVFPEQIGKFHRVAETEFPDKRQGVVIRYEGRGRAEAFVYDMGFAEIPTGVDSEPVKKAFAVSDAGMMRLLASKPASDGQKFLESAPVVEMEGRQAKLLVALYTWTLTGPDGQPGPMATWVLLTGVKNKIVKLIYTAPAPEPTSTQGELKELIVGFLEANAKERRSFFVEKKAPKSRGQTPIS